MVGTKFDGTDELAIDFFPWLGEPADVMEGGILAETLGVEDDESLIGRATQIAGGGSGGREARGGCTIGELEGCVPAGGYDGGCHGGAMKVGEIAYIVGEDKRGVGAGRIENDDAGRRE